jgi:hypothetical protein
MTESATNDICDRTCWEKGEPFGAPSASSEVNRLANFYRVECLTVFGTAGCVSERSVEAPPFEFQAAA